MSDRNHDTDFSFRVTTDVTEEPITLAQACAQCRQDSGIDDTYITTLITVARKYVENYTGQLLCLRTAQVILDDFPPGAMDEIVLPFGPLQSVSSITYKDNANATKTVDSATYTVDKYSPLGSVYLIYPNYWPIEIVQPHSLTITGSFGYGTVASGLIPKDLIHCVLLQLQNLYEHRKSIADGIEPFAIMHSLDSMLAMYRTNWV